MQLQEALVFSKEEGVSLWETGVLSTCRESKGIVACSFFFLNGKILFARWGGKPSAEVEPVKEIYRPH